MSLLSNGRRWTGGPLVFAATGRLRTMISDALSLTVSAAHSSMLHLPPGHYAADITACAPTERACIKHAISPITSLYQLSLDLACCCCRRLHSCSCFVPLASRKVRDAVRDNHE